MTSSVSRLVEYVESPMMPALARKATIPRAAVNSIMTVKITMSTVVTSAVERKQHQRDHPDGDQRGLEGAFAAHLELIGDQRRGAGDIGLDARRRRGLVDDVADGVDGLVGQDVALIAGEIDLHVGRLAVVALRAGRRQRIAPEILNVLDMLFVLVSLSIKPS